MKQLFFATAIVVFLFNACSPAGQIPKSITTKATDDEDFFSSGNAIPAELAEAMIKDFPKHKFRGWRKNKLMYSQAMFEKDDLTKVLNQDNVDSIKFFLAARKDTVGYPIVILAAYLKNKTYNGKIYKSIQYIKAAHYCPPPPGCTL